MNNTVVKIGILLCFLIIGTSAFAQSKILVIASHPYPERSVINKSLQQIVENRNEIVIRNLETLYGNDINSIDVETERKAYEGVDTIVYMFPIHWFNLTPMLKAYFNEVWFEWAPKVLKNKNMLVVATAGGSENSYSHEGNIGVTIDEVLTPMRACANYVGMNYLEPLTFLGVSGADDNEIHSYQQRFKERLNLKN